MKYKIKVWVPVDIEESEDIVYGTMQEALDDKYNMELMQPENIFKIVEVK